MRRVAEEILTALARTGEASTKQLVQATGLTQHQVKDGVLVLHRRALIERLRINGRYRISKSGKAFVEDGGRIKCGTPGPTGCRPTRGTLRDRLWRALRMMRKATIPELLSLASSGNEKNALNNARKYVGILERGGFVVRMANREPGTSPTSNGYIRWILIKDLGPLAPTYYNRKVNPILTDSNTKEEIPL